MFLYIYHKDYWELWEKDPYEIHYGFKLNIDNIESIEWENPRTDEKHIINLNLDGLRIGDKVRVDWSIGERKNSTVPKDTIGQINCLVFDSGVQSVRLNNIFTPIPIKRVNKL